MIPVSAILVLPADPDLRQVSGRRIPLSFKPPHPLSSRRIPVLVDGDGEVLTAESFRRLRVKLGARIETENPAFVCEAIGVPQNEPGIVTRPGAGPAQRALPS